MTKKAFVLNEHHQCGDCIYWAQRGCYIVCIWTPWVSVVWPKVFPHVPQTIQLKNRACEHLQLRLDQEMPKTR